MEISGINVLGGFALKSSQPLDARSVVDQYEDLAWLISSGNAYQGMIVYVNSTGEDKGLYVCKSIDDGTLELVGVGATIDAYTKGEIDTKLEALTTALNGYITDIDSLIGTGVI